MLLAHRNQCLMVSWRKWINHTSTTFIHANNIIAQFEWVGCNAATITRSDFGNLVVWKSNLVG